MELIKFSIVVLFIIAILHCICDAVAYYTNIEDIKRNIRKPRMQLGV